MRKIALAARRYAHTRRVAPKTVLKSMVLICAGAACATTFPAQADDDFALRSPDLHRREFLDSRFIAHGLGCLGKNISPRLEWKSPPPGTRSFALLLHDPDAPNGSGLWHWALYNIPAETRTLPRGAGNEHSQLPNGSLRGKNDFDESWVTSGDGYFGPCPPVGHGPHRYIFTLYALAVPNLHKATGLSPQSSPALHAYMLNYGLGNKVLAKAHYVVTYHRPPS